MKRTFMGLIALGAFAVSGPMAAQQPSVGVYGLKFPVSDFERSVAFYTKYFPLKKDKVYNATEMALSSTEPTSTQRPITLWLDQCATAKGRAALAMAHRLASDNVHRKLSACRSNFRAGTGWLFIMVPDAAATAARMRADGYEAKLVRLPATGPGYLLFLTEDPDGNVVEAVQAVTQ